MALLHRFSKLNDRSNTGIFTFIVTRSVTRDLHRDATTKDFYYGYHRWAISFTRANDKILGVYLILRDTSPSSITYTDFSITLLNREHFSRNEQYGEKQSKFSGDHPAHVSKQILFSLFLFCSVPLNPITVKRCRKKTISQVLSITKYRIFYDYKV